MRRQLLVAALVLTGCGGGDADDTITVFAAASLTDAFAAMEDRFELEHPDADVTMVLAGSQQLVAQIDQGAEADVVATADEDSIAVLGVQTETFASNRLAIVVERGNPLAIDSLEDLAHPGVVLVLAAPEVPAGRYAAEVLDRAGVDAAPRSLEESVKAVVTRVALGEADAGIAYVTDAAAAGDDVEAIDIPPADNVDARYPIALLDTDDDLAAAFVDLVLSARGREILGRFGFLAP